MNRLAPEPPKTAKRQAPAPVGGTPGPGPETKAQVKEAQTSGPTSRNPLHGAIQHLGASDAPKKQL